MHTPHATSTSARRVILLNATLHEERHRTSPYTRSRVPVTLYPRLLVLHCGLPAVKTQFIHSFKGTCDRVFVAYDSRDISAKLLRHHDRRVSILPDRFIYALDENGLGIARNFGHPIWYHSVDSSTLRTFLLQRALTVHLVIHARFGYRLLQDQKHPICVRPTI